MPQDEASTPPRNQHLRADRPAHEQLLMGLTEQDYNQWRHHPLTAAYLLYLADLRTSFRTSAADLLEAGRLAPQADELRGRLLNLMELQELSLDAIQNFYRHEETEENDGSKADQGTAR